MDIDRRDEARLASLLVAVGSRRDADAYDRLFGHYAPRVKGFLIRTGLGEGAAEDCMQDVMVAVWRKAHLFDPARAGASTWIFSVARNRKIDLQRRARRPEPEDLPWGPEPDLDQADAIAMQEDTRRLADAIAQLPPAQRDLIERAFYGEMSHGEIAADTGLPLGTIKSRLRLAMDRLRRAMETDPTGATSLSRGEALDGS